MEDKSDFERYYAAFHRFSEIISTTDEIRFLVLLIKNQKENCNVFHKIIMDQLDVTKEKSFDIFKKLEKKEIVEEVNFCPYCEKSYIDKKIPPVCDVCSQELISENINLNNGRDYPKYFIRIVEDKKEFVRGFIRFFAELRF